MVYVGFDDDIWIDLEYDHIQKDKYEMNQFGIIRFKDDPDRIKKPFIDKWGYYETRLNTDIFFDKKGKKERYSKNYKPHVLVMVYFGEKEERERYLKYKHTRKIVINHKDGNKLNNHISNLEVITQKENIQHAAKMNLKKSGLEVTSFKWLNEEILKEICRLFESRATNDKIIDELNLLQYGDSRKRIRHFLNNLYCGATMNSFLQKETFHETQIDVNRPRVYDDNTIELICKRLDEGYKNYQIVEELYVLLGFDGSIQMKRRYKALVSNIKNRVHRTDISDKYNFWK